MFTFFVRKAEQRLMNSLLRSQAPVHKKLGKQLMFRSPPIKREKKVVKVKNLYFRSIFFVKVSNEDIEAEMVQRVFGVSLPSINLVNSSSMGSDLITSTSK
jgi:hypothetical protein